VNIIAESDKFPTPITFPVSKAIEDAL